MTRHIVSDRIVMFVFSKDHGDDDMDMETLEHVRWSDGGREQKLRFFQDWRPAEIRGHGV